MLRKKCELYSSITTKPNANSISFQLLQQITHCNILLQNQLRGQELVPEND